MDLASLRAKILLSQTKLASNETKQLAANKPADSLPNSPLKKPPLLKSIPSIDLGSENSQVSEIWDNSVSVPYGDVVDPSARGLSAAKSRLKAVLAATKFSTKIPSQSQSPEPRRQKPRSPTITSSASSSSASPPPRRIPRQEELRSKEKFLAQGRAVETLVKVFERRNVPSGIVLKRRAFRRLRGREVRVAVRVVGRVLAGAVASAVHEVFRQLRAQITARIAGSLHRGYDKVKDGVGLMDAAEISGGRISIAVNTNATTRLHKAIVVCHVMGRFIARLEAEISRNFRLLFARLRWTRKRQMEIAFLKAAVGELKKLESR